MQLRRAPAGHRHRATAGQEIGRDGDDQHDDDDGWQHHLSRSTMPQPASRGLANRYLHGQRRELTCGRAHRLDDVLRKWDQALVHQVAFLADRGIAGEFRDVLANSRDDADMSILDIEVERASFGYLPSAMFSKVGATP